jgi:PAS domain S-box-containing protein
MTATGALVENAPLAMAVFDRAMRYVLANRQWIREFGLQHVQPIIGRCQYEIFPNLHPGWRQVYDRALQGHIVRSEHDAGGKNTVYRWEVRPWRKSADASVGGLMVTCEKFSAGQKLGESEPPEEQAPAETAATTLPDPFDCSLPMLLLNEAGVIIRVNASAAHLTLDKGMHEGSTTLWEAFASPAEVPVLREQWREVLAMDKPVVLSTRRASEPVPTRWIVSALRPEKQAENVADLRFVAVAVPPSLDPVSAAYPPAPEARPVTPVVPPEMVQKLENELSRAQQELRTMMEAERAFVKRETRLRGFLEGVPCGIFVLDERGGIVYQNERLAKLLGRGIEKDSGVEAWLVHGCPTTEHREHVTLAWRESVWRRQLTRTMSLATADGLLKEIEFQPVALSGGGLLVSIQDVTENCRHEEQLRGLEAKMRTLLQGSPLAIVLTDKSGVIFEVNQHAEELLGQPKSELRRYPLDAWLDPESAAARRDALRVMHGQGSAPEALGVRVKRGADEFVDVILHLSIVPDSQGDPHCTIHFFQLQGDEPAIAAEPAASEDLSVPVPPPAPPPPVTQVLTVDLLACDVNGRITAWSAHAQELFDFDAATATGRPLHLLFRPSDATGFFTTLAEQSAVAEQFFEHSYFGAEGRGTMPVSVLARPEGGFVLRTRREHTIIPEAATEAASPLPQEEPAPHPGPPAARVLRGGAARAFQVVAPSSHRWPVIDLEREKLMLSETHHRIKNHLQIISSLLNMQINGVSDQHARDALRSSQNRVRAIAALHQHLYQLALGGGVTFSDFTKDLIQHLRECYEMPQEQVAVGLSIQEGSIDPEWLMPLALTLNEALSNTFEHAFPHGRKGSITATLRYAADFGELIIRDDGVGLPSDFHPGDSPGLGLKILAVFADQMRGQLFVQGTPDQGTEVKLRFPTGHGAAAA